MELRAYLLIITLNVNGLNVPTKRHRPAEWIQKQDKYICCLQEAHFRSRDTHRLKVRGWKKANLSREKKQSVILKRGRWKLWRLRNRKEKTEEKQTKPKEPVGQQEDQYMHCAGHRKRRERKRRRIYLKK